MYHIKLNLPLKLYLWLSISAFFLLLGACSTDNLYESQQKWLEKNYPDREKNISKLDKPTPFKQEILAGNVEEGMLWQEVLVAKDLDPFGPKAMGTVFWCKREKRVTANNECITEALLVTKYQSYFFETVARGLEVVAIHKNRWRPYQMQLPDTYDLARAIFKGQ